MASRRRRFPPLLMLVTVVLCSGVGVFRADWALLVVALLGWWPPMTVLALRRALARRDATVERLRHAFRCLEESVIISDRQGLILEVNPAFTRLFGWSAAEARGQKTSLLKSGAQDKPFYEALWKRLDEGQPWEGRVINRTRAGERVEVLLVISPLRDERGQLLGYVSVHRDLRPFVAHEQQLAASLVEMEKLKLAAEAASAAKTRFLATMSHEIRTPLAGVLGTLELLEHEPLAPAQRQYADLALRSSRALLGVLNDVLDFSRIEAGRLQLEHLAFDAWAVAREVRELFFAQTQHKRLDFDLELEGDTAWVVGDALHLRQVLSNLVGNAVKFTERGRVVLRARVVEHAGQASVTFEVEDTGIGISASDREHLFNPFTQADASMQRRFGGSGLGLAISRRLTRAMGGELELHSEPGVGSTFCFTLRLERAQVRVSSPAPAEPFRARLTGLRVLVAEDNAVNQLVLTRLLQRLGCSVVVVGDGEAALAQMASRALDVVLMDCQMPGVDGLEATRRARASSCAWREVPIIAVTANAYAEDHAACLAAGMSGFLTKPVCERDLVTLLTELVPAPARLRLVSSSS